MLNKESVAKLIYLVSFVINADTPKRPYYMLDAQTGKIIRQWEGLTYFEATGPGGNTKTGKYYYGKDYSPLIVDNTCKMTNDNVTTYNLKHATSGGTIFQFKCPDNTFDEQINGAFSPINDAHFFGGIVHDLYQNWLARPPLTFKLKMMVHYGKNYENAFWDGQQMSFGDGASYFYPLVSLDVTSHEISHGYTEQHSNLAYENQAGGLNESFSDMAGEAAKYYVNTNKPDAERNDWLVGASIIKAANQALRYFDDPTRDGYSIASAKDYTDGMEVHKSSGVFNKGFYLLAHQPGWNTQSAFITMVTAQTYWTEDSTFDEAACGVTKAAKDLNYNPDSVIAAFKGVDVDASCGANPTPGDTGKLKNGVPVTGLKGQKNSEVFYSIDVPKGRPYLTVSINGGQGDADLYVRYGSKPSDALFDCRPFIVGNSESCRFRSPQMGTYYIRIKGYANYSGLTLSGSY